MEEGDAHQGSIGAIVEAQITVGCHDPSSPIARRFCPDDDVTRAQVVVFLGRALGLNPLFAER